MRKWLRVFTYIYHKNQPNAGKYTSPMDPMEVMETFHIYIIYDRPIKELFMGFNGFNLIMVRGLCFLHKLFSFPEDPCNWYMYRHFTIKVNHSCREIYHFFIDPIKEIHGLVFSMHVFKRKQRHTNSLPPTSDQCLQHQKKTHCH